MATETLPAGDRPGNPTIINLAEYKAARPPITSIEPQSVTVAPDHDTGGVLLEIVDRVGSGFATILDQLVAIDVAIRLIGSVARLRGRGGLS
jgi:hypothetical protein